MKRIIVLLTVALLMAAMMAASSIPASAVNDKGLEHACGHHPGVSHVPFCPTTV